MQLNFSAHVAANTLKVCNAPRCGLPRAGINVWCKNCLSKARLYGHPHAKPLRASQWAIERKEVAALFATNADHPGFLQVLKFLQGWMDTATQNESAYRGAEEMARLQREGVTPMQVLTEVLAFWLWTSRPEAKAVLPSNKALDVALSRAVFGLAPRPRRVTSGITRKSGTWGLSAATGSSYSPKPRCSALGYVGKYLRETLAVFLVTVGQGVEQQRALKVDPEALLKVPFTVQRPQRASAGLPFP